MTEAIAPAAVNGTQNRNLQPEWNARAGTFAHFFPLPNGGLELADRGTRRWIFRSIVQSYRV